MEKKNTKPDDSMNDSLDTLHGRRRLAKTSADHRLVKSDGEFRFESKHYHKQAKKLAQGQVSLPLQRSSRAGRERTHRCYLCFKLFPSAGALETHKENYHLAKSERPVRVKTDTGLDEWEELASSTAPALSPPHEASEEVTVKEEPVDLSEDFDNITIIIDESVKSHVLKPLCIACKAYTSDDFRNHSKWFRLMPDDFQSDLLTKFQQFFPCTFNPSSLVEPWVLCKKCAILIDKIADMEEKLNSMKSDLLLRVQGSSETSSDADQKDLSSESNTRESNQIKSLSSLVEGNMKGLGRSLSDIEAYMKDTCEIMEITKENKRPGRPKKHVKEKLTPVLVEGKEEGDSEADIVGFITHSLVKNEHKNIQMNLAVDSDSNTKYEEEKSSSRTRVQSNSTVDDRKLKQEPMQYEPDNDGSSSVSWDATSLSNQSSQLHNAGAGPEKRAPLGSHSFSSEIILNNFEGGSEADSQSDILQTKMTECLGSPKSKPQSYCDIFPLKSEPTSSKQESQDLDAVDEDRCDASETSVSRDPYERDDESQSGLEDHVFEVHDSTASEEEQSERLPTTPTFLEDEKTDILPQAVAKQVSFPYYNFPVDILKVLYDNRSGSRVKQNAKQLALLFFHKQEAEESSTKVLNFIGGDVLLP